MLKVAILSLIFAQAIFPVLSVCSLSVMGASVVIRKTTGTTNFDYLPIDSKNMLMNENEEVHISCPNGSLLIAYKDVKLGIVHLPNNQHTCKAEKLKPSKTMVPINYPISVECVYTEPPTFRINHGIVRKPVLVETIKCIPFRDTARIAKTSSTDCDQTEIEVGFQLDEIDDDKFARLYLVCFDWAKANTLFVKQTMAPLTSEDARVKDSAERVNFRQDSFYPDWDVNNAYNNQHDTIKRLLGPCNSNSDAYFANGNSLTRGHFAAKADFIFESQQIATFHYVNTAPQWKRINDGNWAIIEKNVRGYALKYNNKVELTIYTGSHGTMKLDNVEIYLEKGNLLPVPQLYWKVVYDSKSKMGIAIITNNNPYDLSNKQVCSDVDQTNSFPWLNGMSRTDHVAGFSYLCRIDDLRKVVRHVPQMYVKALLK